MKTNISNRLIATLQPGEKPYEIRDVSLPGLILRVQPSGLMVYYIEYRRGKRYKIGRHPAFTPHQARGAARKVLADACTGGDPQAAKKAERAHSLESFIDEVYESWAKANIRTAGATVKRLKGSFPDLLKKKLGEITLWEAEKWRSKKLKDGLKPSAVNRPMTDLKSLLAKAVTWGFIEASPLAGIKPCKVDDKGRVRFLTKDEEKNLRKALDTRAEELRQERDKGNQWRERRHYQLYPDLRKFVFADRMKPMVLLSLNTGLRRGELFNLRWEAVDFAQQTITIHGDGAKSGKTRHVPLNKEALQLLLDWRKQSNASPLAHVFPGEEGKRLTDVKKSWDKILKKAEIEGFRWHDLRHSFASKLVMASVDLNTVRELLGHSDYKMTLRYAHLAPEHRAQAVALISGL